MIEKVGKEKKTSSPWEATIYPDFPSQIHMII
jgi:hypothetical protein